MGTREGGLLGALVLPMVQRLFVRVVGNIEVSLFLWDVLMLYGAPVLPAICASCLLVLKGPLDCYISDNGSWTLLERTLNAAAKGLSLWQVRDTVQRQLLVGQFVPAQLGGGEQRGRQGRVRVAGAAQAEAAALQRTPSLNLSLSYARYGARSVVGEGSEEGGEGVGDAPPPYDLGMLARAGVPRRDGSKWGAGASEGCGVPELGGGGGMISE